MAQRKDNTMAIAVFLESYEPTMGAHKRQILLVPHNGNTKSYMRITDGQKGPQNAWRETDVDTIVTAYSTSNEFITREISGIVVTAADSQAIENKGYSPVLGTKAVQAHEKAMPATNIAAIDAYSEAYEMVELQSEGLQDLIIDKRRVRGPVAAPMPAVPVQQVPVQIIPEAETVMQQPAAPATLQLHLASVPKIELAQRYVHRTLAGGLQDFRVFDYSRANNINVLIYGPTGPGKTTSVEAWAAERGLRMATVSGNAALEPGHLFGKYIPDGKGNYIWVDGPVTDVVRNGGVLLMDEFNFISPKIYTVIYPLTDGRRTITLLDHMGEVIEAHKDLTIFATMNPDYVGTSPLNFAMRNRFDIQIPWDYDEKVESKLVESKALRAMVKQLRDEAAKGTYETPISTNMMMEFEKLSRDLNFEFAAENFIAHFSTDEQASVRMIIQTHTANLQAELKPDAVEIITDAGDESEYKPESGQSLDQALMNMLKPNH